MDDPGRARDGALAEAADFVVRLSSEDATEADWHSLEAWLAKDPRHLAAYEQAERAWAEVEEAAGELAARWPNDESSPGIVDLAARRRPTRRWWIGGAATAAAAAVLAAGLLLPPAATIYETAPGQTRVVDLKDGSRITMNGASHLTVRLGRNRREIDMEDAEAVFEVAKDKARPFIVSAGPTRVEVVGTEFNVRRTAGRTDVAVRRGVVEVASAASPSTPVRLTAGQQVTQRDGDPVSAARSVDPRQAMAWREGRLVYTDRPLSEVAQDLSRRFATPIAADPRVAGLRFTGVLILDDQDEVIARLESFLPVRAHRASGAITLSPR